MQQFIEVYPSLPEPIQRLEELAKNLWFSWNPEARSLFYRLDRDLWRRVGHNPILFLRCISQKKLQAAAQDRTYLGHYRRIMAMFDVYNSDVHTWYSNERALGGREVIAYFSAEFGVHESLPIFSGGLGVLAGDHCKSASDLGLPLVGVGLLYRMGYFVQHIDRNGQQQDLYEEHDFSEMPVQEVIGPDGTPLQVDVALGDRTVNVKVWKAMVGRNPLFLLDTDIDRNSFHDRMITHQLYGGDLEMRICQEIILGMGGARALHAMGIRPSVWHMNEGHSVFLGLERIRQMVTEYGLGFYEAKEVVCATTLFTTHTPVAAGHDAFPLTFKDKYFRAYWESMGLSRQQFLELGLEIMPDGHEVFSLTVLALNLSGWCNGVSRLHGKVSSDMWSHMWPGVPAAENPITSVTNGVHTLSWLAPEMSDLFDQHLGEEWRANLTNPEFWEKVYKIPDPLFWGVHQSLKRRMIERIRERRIDQLERNREGAAAMREVAELLNPDALTIGFARRFATYKRADLIFHDLPRLARLVNDPARPVQIIFAGKAHPADRPGQELIQKIHTIASRDEFRGKIVLVEGYDISIARYLVSGVDVWLNTPQRPFEASGTSGMKAIINGGINLSVLDGWWCEAAEDGLNGWSIGDERPMDDPDRQLRQDAQSLYQILEQSIIPLYYARNSKGLPENWLKIAKTSVKTILPIFNTDRMVAEYAQRFYFPAIDRGKLFSENGFQVSRDLTHWRQFIRQHWDKVGMAWLVAGEGRCRRVEFGKDIPILARVTLGAIPVTDIVVEAFTEEITPRAEKGGPYRIPMRMVRQHAEGVFDYAGTFIPPDSGRYNIAVRMRPEHPDLVHPFDMGMIKWLYAEDGAVIAESEDLNVSPEVAADR